MSRERIVTAPPARSVAPPVALSKAAGAASPLLDLQHRIGNRAATAMVLARRTEPGEGASNQYDPGPERERNIADPDSGRSMRRLRVTGLPDAYTDWAIVLVPSTPPPAGKPIDILLHLHGFSPGYEGLGHTEGKQPNTDADDIDLYRIGPQMAAAGRPMIGILPQGSELSDFNANDPKKTAKQNANSKGFDADNYITAVFKRLTDMGAWRGGGAPTPGPVVLSGHSGADAPIAQMVSGDLGPEKLAGLFLFDTMYPGAGFEKTIWNAIERRLNQDLATLKSIAAAAADPAAAQRQMVEWVQAKGFRLYNVHGGFYGQSSVHLVTERDRRLRNNKKVIGRKGSPVFQAIVGNLKVTSGGGGHWGIISADDHLETAIDMLPATPAKAAPVPGGPAEAQKPVQRQPTDPPPPPPPPPPTPAELVAAAAERVRTTVQAAAAPLVGTANGDDVVGILTQQLITRQANPSAALRRRNPTHPALALYDALYGTDVVADLATIDTRSPGASAKARRKAANATRREVFAGVLGGLVTDVRPRTAVTAPAAPLDQAVQVAGEQALVAAVLPFISTGRTWEDVRVGVITEFGGLVDGTRTALARANDYYGRLEAPVLTGVTQNTRVHPDLNAAFQLANPVITARLAATPEPQRTQIATAIRTSLGRRTFSAVLRENRNAPHRLSDHSFGFAIDIDSPRNPNISDRGGLGPVQDVTGDDPTAGVTTNRTGAQVEAVATDLRDISDEYKTAMASDASLAPVLMRLANEHRARMNPVLPALTSGAGLVAAVVLGQERARRAALRTALWPEGAAIVPTTPPTPIPPEIVAAEGRINRIGNAFRASFTNAARTTKVAGDSEATPGSVAAEGFMSLPSILVGALAGSDGGNLRWLGPGTHDFMHFELMTRPPLFTSGAIVDPAPPDAAHTTDAGGGA